MGEKACILSLDIFKVFDCVQWSTLKILLRRWGFGRKLLGVIDQLYSENTSAVVVNDGITEQITLGRGTRQGCPLSPVLFCIVIELLADAIRKDIGKNEKIKINLFANDSLLTINNQLESMPIIKLHLKEFVEITGLCVNWQKSEMLLFNHTKQEWERMNSYGLKESQNLRYLGVNLTKNIQRLREQNFDKLKREVKMKLKLKLKLKINTLN